MNCPVCSGPVETISRRRDVIFKGKFLQVLGDKATKCLKCKQEYYTQDQSKIADKKLMDTYKLVANKR